MYNNESLWPTDCLLASYFVLRQGAFQAQQNQVEAPLDDGTEVDHEGFVTVTPETIIVQHGQEVVLASSDPGEDGTNQYVIQYIMPEDGGEVTSQPLALQEITVQPVEGDMSGGVNVQEVVSSKQEVMEVTRSEEVMSSSSQDVLPPQDVLHDAHFTGDSKMAVKLTNQRVEVQETPAISAAGLRHVIQVKSEVTEETAVQEIMDVQ